jgi:hypothetical protein
MAINIIVAELECEQDGNMCFSVMDKFKYLTIVEDTVKFKQLTLLVLT